MSGSMPMMGGPMMIAMGLFWVLLLVIMVLTILWLIKQLRKSQNLEQTLKHPGEARGDSDRLSTRRWVLGLVALGLTGETGMKEHRSTGVAGKDRRYRCSNCRNLA